MDEERKKKVMSLASELARDMRKPEEFEALSAQLKKMMVEAALEAEMEDHLGYEKHSREGIHSGNSRNGKGRKTLKGEHGEIEIETPRDREGTFEPVLVKKGQRRVTGMDDQILSLYAKGMTTREVSEMFEELYGVEVSPTLVSRVTDTVLDRVEEWRERPLDDVYPVVYLDCIVLKVREDTRVINKSVYLALGINIEGNKELLGMWISENEGASFWLSVLTDIKARGVEQILIACVDGLTGFPDAIAVEYPKAKVQLCIVHMVRNSLRFVSWKNKRAVASDIRKIYKSPTEKAARGKLDEFEKKWGEKYPQIHKSWNNHWDNLITIYDYPDEIRKVIYTTNAIESLNSVIRKATKKRKIFPTDSAAFKIVFLATQSASKKWTRPVASWEDAMSRFLILFKNELEPYI